MPKYDDASWHYGGNYPKNLSHENASIHIGMFIAWCIENDLMSEEQMEDSEEEIQKVKNHEMTGAHFLVGNCDEKFCDFDLSELGRDFANDYYNDNTQFAKRYNCYRSDFCDVFNKLAEEKGFEYESLYHIEDTWENYETIKLVINQRFNEWKKYRKR